MIDNTKVYQCVCRVKGLTHSFTTDCSGRYILMVDPNHAHLLRDSTWTVGKMHRKSTLVRARANSRAPDIKRGVQLHQLVMRTREKRRHRVWAINRNYLDARRENLRLLTYADVRILSSTRPCTKAVGVRKNAQPKFMKTWRSPWSAHISVNCKSVYLGAFETLELAQAAFDAAAVMVHGPNATRNVSLGFLSADVAQTKPCRRAAKAARQVLRDYYSGELAKKHKALLKAKSRRKALQIFSDIRAIGRPAPSPRVEVARFGAAGM